MQLLFRTSLFAAVVMTSAMLLADIPTDRPRFNPPPQPDTKPIVSVPVEVSYAKANGNPAAKIVIPLETLKSLAQSAQANNSFTLPLGAADPSQPTSGFPHGGTIIAGIAISLAMLSLVYLVRRKPAQKWAVTGTTVVLLGLGITSFLWADIKIPGQPYRGSGGPLPERVTPVQHAGPMVTLEIAEKGDKILITVPPQGP